MKIHVESKLDKPVYVNLVCSTTPIKINPNSIRPQVLTENRSIDVNMEGECFNTQGYVLQVWDTLVYNQEPKTYALFDKDYALTTKTENNDISIRVVKTLEEGVLYVQLDKKQKILNRIILAIVIIVSLVLIGIGIYFLIKYTSSKDGKPSRSSIKYIQSTQSTQSTQSGKPAKINPILK